MPRFLNRFYVKYIRPADPGFFIARYAGKAAVACLAAFSAAVVSGIRGDLLFWWMVGAVCTVLFRTGSTLKRRKIYALILLASACLCVPAAALAGGQGILGLAFIFFVSFFCFFISTLGVSASTLGTGCLVVSLIAFFSPAELVSGLLRALGLLAGGLISFGVNFYLWPFDPERVLLSSAKVAVEDMGFFFDGLCVRLEHPRVPEPELTQLSLEAAGSLRRYRGFLESFNIDPLKGSRADGGPGIFYFALIRIYESIVGLFSHIHFTDDHPEFNGVRQDFLRVAGEIQKGMDAFSRMGGGEIPDFDPVFQQIDMIQKRLWDMGGYQRGDEVREKFLDAWGAVYELKNLAQGLDRMMRLADHRFRLEGGQWR